MYGAFLRPLFKPNSNDRASRKTLDCPCKGGFTLHRSLSDAEWNANSLLTHRQAETNRKNQPGAGVSWTLPPNHATTCVPYHFLHVYFTAARKRSAMESRRNASRRHMQTTLVEKSALHSQLVWILQHVPNSHSSRRNRHGALRRCTIFDSGTLEVAQKGNEINNRSSDSVNDCTILCDLHIRLVKLCLFRNKVIQLNLVIAFQKHFCLLSTAWSNFLRLRTKCISFRHIDSQCILWELALDIFYECLRT